MDTLRLLTRGSGIRLNDNVQTKPFAVPSEGKSTEEDVEILSNSRKRKRDGYENKTLSQAEIREFQNRHKIRMTDLLALHGLGTSASRKSQKESSRIFSQPLQSFSQLEHLAVGPKLTSNVSEQGYRGPTEVQSATIPVLLQTKLEEPNLLTIAPTGSGKTLAFLIPLINHLTKSRAGSGTEMVSRHVSAIILAPTKELVAQIVNEGRKLTMGTGVRITAFRKGMRLHDDISLPDGEAFHEDSSQEEANSASSIVKADIIVSTPLSLVHAASSNDDSKLVELPHIRHLILDEADILLDSLFREQTLSVWSTCSNPLLRVSLWSATIGSNIEELAIETITARQKTLQIRHPPPLLRTIIGLKDTSLPTISHKLIYASTEPGKLMGLRQLLHPPPSTSKSKAINLSVLRPPFLVFTQTIDRANALHHELLYDIPNPSNAAIDIPRIAVLHSSLTGPERSTIMTNFRLGKIWILITTDLLSRGVDFRGVNGVVNYDIPTTAASYIHRAGRTGRAGREGGICITFYTRDDVKYLKVIANVIAASEKATGTVSKDGNTDGSTIGGVPSWLLQALPNLTKADRKDLKTRGVNVRRGAKESDTAKEKKIKGKNRIGTTSGYERREENRKTGAIEGSKRRKRKEREQQQEGEDDDQEFGGFD